MINVLGLLITIVVYFLCTKLKNIKLFKKLPPIILTTGIIILILKFSPFKYVEYNQSASLLTFLLGPATIALAYTLTQNIKIVSTNKRILFFGMLIASLLGIVITFTIGTVLNASYPVLLSMIPKSVTTPIAIEISKSIGGIPELTACIVILTGIIGGLPAHRILNTLKIKHNAAKGLAIGASSHVLGTSRCIEKKEYEQAAISSITLIIVGILTAILAPFIIWLFSTGIHKALIL